MDAAVEEAVRHVTGHPDFAGRFRHPVKFNGSDFVETRLSAEEQLAETSKLASKSLHVFLERYGNMLPVSDLHALATIPAASTAEAQFWLERLQREPPKGDRMEKLRRRRRWVWARREMARPDGFFSEDEMKRRDPQLFHRVVGRHLDSGLRLSAPMQGSLSGYLMQQLERECEGAASGGGADAAAAGDRPAAAAVAGGGGAAAGEPDRAAAGAGGRVAGDDDDDDALLDDEESSGSSGEDGGGKRRRLQHGEALPDDAAVRRAKFLKAMRDRFVQGQEPGFDYAPLDEDSELDDVVELGRDAEDKYFDGEE